MCGTFFFLDGVKLSRAGLIFVLCRTLVYVEGDASLRSWENAEGQKQQALNIVQRMCSDMGRYMMGLRELIFFNRLPGGP